MENINVTWIDFMNSSDDEKRDLIIRSVNPDTQDWDATKIRMSELAVQLGLKNPAPLYRVAYNVNALTMPEEIAAQKERAKNAKKTKFERRERAAAQAETRQAAQGEPQPEQVAGMDKETLLAYLAPEVSIENRMAALESLVREMAEEIKLLRRVLLLM